MTFLTPHSTLKGHTTRVRTVSMPEQRLKMTVVTANSTVTTTPITRRPLKSSISSSRQQTPRHQQSVSLEIPQTTIPRPSPINTFPSTPKFPKSATPQSVHNSVPISLRYHKDDPLMVIQSLRTLLAGRGLELKEYLHIDDLVALHDREIMERAHPLKPAQGRQGSQEYTANDMLSVFGVTVRQTSLYASTKAIFGGCEHELPIIVFSCVEELHQKGLSPIHHLHKFTKPSHRLRQLIETFGAASSSFGLYTSLANEYLDDIYGLLAVYLSRLPEPVFAPSEIAPGFESAIFEWCIVPEPDSPSPSPNQIRIVQLLLRLLPSPHLSLFIYLMAFICQMTAREEASEVESIGTAFGHWMFYGEKSTPGGQDKAVVMTIWFIRNWGFIINGFFDDLPLSSGPIVLQSTRGDASARSYVPESLPSLNELVYNEGGGKNEVKPSGSAIKLGTVQGQSYQCLTTNSESSCTASLIDGENSSPTASNSKQSDNVLDQSEDLEEGLSEYHSRSALNEHDNIHLPSLEAPNTSRPHTPVVRSLPRPPLPPAPKIQPSEVISTSEFRPPSTTHNSSQREHSPELKLDETYKRPKLRVVNCASSVLDDSVSPGEKADDDKGLDNEHYDPESRRYGDRDANADVYGFFGYTTASYSSSSTSDSSSTSESDELDCVYDGLTRDWSKDVEFNNNCHERGHGRGRLVGLKGKGKVDVVFDRERDAGCQCEAGCKAYALVKELEERLAVVTKERDDAVRRVHVMSLKG